MQDFIHLNVHSHYSILKSTITIPEAVDKAIADGQRGMALTDDGVMYGIKEFVDYCAKVNNARMHEGLEPFKPIIGCEMYVAPRTTQDKVDGDNICSRIIVLAKNLTGYKNLMKLVSRSWTEGLMDETPRTNLAELERYRDGLIVCSLCIDGEVSSRILRGDINGAKESVEKYKSIFKEDYYIDLQRHVVHESNQYANQMKFAQQQNAERTIIELAHDCGVKLICSNACRFLYKENFDVLERLECLAQGKTIRELRTQFSGQEWFKTQREMNDVFADIPEALNNTLEILNKVEEYSIENCSLYPNLPQFHIPEDFGTIEAWKNRFTIADLAEEFLPYDNGNEPITMDIIQRMLKTHGSADNLYQQKLEFDYLSKLVYEGAERLYVNPLSSEVEERIRYELDIIKTKKAVGYFLFVQDFVHAAVKELGIWIGPGRGSAAGSIVNYCLGITKIDPLKYGLLFERFLYPDIYHFSFPDIDIDFDAEDRGQVIQWLKGKYGKENFAHIMTIGNYSAKIAIKDIAQVEGLSLERTNTICESIPRGETRRLKTLIKSSDYNGAPEYPELVAAMNSVDPCESNTIKYAQIIEGKVCSIGIHACGIVICPTPVSNYVPVFTTEDPDCNDKQTIVTQYDHHAIKYSGLCKFDLLGFRILTEMKDCIRLIKENRGIDIDIAHIPLDDAETFRLFQEGRTTGTFQFESNGMQKYLRELHPTVFEDLIALNALYRPGPLDYIPPFIERKNGREVIYYDLPIMEKYLKETSGIVVYQEQIMHLAREIGGLSRGQSDVVRKAMGSRIKDIVDDLKPMFIEGGVNNGYDPKVLEKLWREWEAFAPYAFNKSHAVAYTLVAFQTAYLKAHYPEEYMTTVLKSRSRNEEEVLSIMRECKAMGITLSSPEINIERIRHSIRGKYNLYYGFIKDESGYVAKKVNDQEDYDFYLADGGFHTTSSKTIRILDSFLVDPLEAKGWNYDVWLNLECSSFEGYSYKVEIKKNGERIRFQIKETSDGVDCTSLFVNIMLKIALQCETINDVESVLSDNLPTVDGYGKPVEQIKQEAESGNVDMQEALAQMYYRGCCVKEDFDKAFEWFVKAAEAGSIESQKKLGIFYTKGIGLEQDCQKAIEWYTKAAASGDIRIISTLAELHSKVSISWYEKAAELGSMEALEKLAEYYYKLGDFVKAGTLYKKLNENGRYNVMIGHCYYELEYYSESVKYYNIGAQQKDVDAFIALGKCYYLGHGVLADRAKANEYFLAAIEAKKAKDDLPF